MKNYKITSCIGLYLILISSHLSHAQSKKFNPDEVLIGNKKIPAVLLVGSFHFAYYNLDAHVVEEKDQVNVLSPNRQFEMLELIDYIARFRPTKILVEAGSNTGYLMHRYRKYLRRESNLSSDEMEQIGFRLLEKFDLDTIYGVNEGTLVNSLYNHRDSLILRPILDSIFDGWDFRSEDEISRSYSKYYKHKDSLALELSLLDIFKMLNSEKAYERGYGAYLNGDFKLGTTEGADALALHWYSRNLRIYRRIQDVTTSPEDRILVLYGAGHMGIFHHLFKSDPAYDLVLFEELSSQ